ncbi:MAG TPA: SCO family protein [Candidatus Aquilonibacter sp.]|nr:SCO family protein [Candidatus Aquilonibacter sp.]
MQQGNHERRPAHAALALAVVCCVFGLAACKHQQDANAKRYHLVGKVVALDVRGSSVVVDHQAIPGFMDAMTMAYPVRDPHILDPLGVGDEITADVVVASDGAYLDNIVVTKKGTGGQGAPPTTEHEPTPGEKVPDFALTNQDGKRIHLSSFEGHVLLVTFVYTRCPFPTFCPLVSRNFAEVYAQTRKNPALASKVRLLTISFDPAHDTPKVLRAYGGSFQDVAGAIPFDRWQFAVPSQADLKKIADYFGLFFTANGGQIVHSLSTTVISPEGTVYKWYEDNQWTPSDLVADASAALQQDNSSTAVAKSDPAKEAPRPN